MNFLRTTFLTACLLGLGGCALLDPKPVIGAPERPEPYLFLDVSAARQQPDLKAWLEGPSARPQALRRAPAEQVQPTPERPLAGLRIALDPGHVGGAWLG